MTAIIQRYTKDTMAGGRNESGEGSSPSERAGKRMYERWQHSAKKMLSSPARKRNGSNGSGGGGRKDVRVKHYQTSEELALMAW